MFKKKEISLVVLIIFIITNIMILPVFGAPIVSTLNLSLLGQPSSAAQGKISENGYTYYEVTANNTITDASAPNWATSGGITKTGGLDFNATRFAGTAPANTAVSSKTLINNPGEAGYYEISSGTQHALTTVSNQFSVNGGSKISYNITSSPALKPDNETWVPATQIWNKLGDRIYLNRGDNTIELFGSGNTGNQNFRLDLLRIKLIEPVIPSPVPSHNSNNIAQGKISENGYTYYEVTVNNTITDASAPNWATSGGITKTGGVDFNATRFAGTALANTAVSSKTLINNQGEAGYYEIWSGAQHALTTAFNKYSVNGGSKINYNITSSSAVKPSDETWEPATQIWNKLGDRIYLNSGENTIELFGSGNASNQNFRLDLFKMKFIESELSVPRSVPGEDGKLYYKQNDRSVSGSVAIVTGTGGISSVMVQR